MTTIVVIALMGYGLYLATRQDTPTVWRAHEIRQRMRKLRG
jgi:hypothetical protein